MSVRHQYTVDIRWDSDRKGTMCSPELTVSGSERGCISVATPPEFPKGMIGIWSPEHLFTASVGSCFMTTFLAIAENSKLQFLAFECRAIGILDQVDNRLQMTAVDLFPVVTIGNEQDRDRAQRVIKKTAENCLISESIKSTVTVSPDIKIHVLSQQA